MNTEQNSTRASASQNCACNSTFVDPRCKQHGAHEYHGKPELPHDMTQTRTEQSVNWSKAFCPVCQPIVNGHFVKREHEWADNAEQYRATIERLSAHAGKLAEALERIIRDDDLAAMRHAEAMIAAYEEARK